MTGQATTQPRCLIRELVAWHLLPGLALTGKPYIKGLPAPPQTQTPANRSLALPSMTGCSSQPLLTDTSSQSDTALLSVLGTALLLVMLLCQGAS